MTNESYIFNGCKWIKCISEKILLEKISIPDQKKYK